ncbi:50S ribosomal protein L15 [Patescibacteria group bacterium]|nr:50S ribosomal protein L15 [Patescibacteria group bacterium]
MQLHEITSEKTSKDRRRVGRGIGSGMGKTSGRGTKGQKSRTGGGIPARFEGGQTPIIQRLPKHKGFRRPHRPKTFVINLTHLVKLSDNGNLTLANLKQRGYLNPGERVKILSEGEISVAVNVETNAISKNARSKIEAAGGKITIV